MARRFRSGFASFIGRPNVGKSTLLNRLVGEKVAIVSPKPQTTRHRIVGVVTRPKEGQVAFVDTPGIHQAKGPLNRLMVETALAALDEVDVVLYVIDGLEVEKKLTLGPDDALILERLRSAKKPTVLVINKIDRLAKEKLLPIIDRFRKELSFTEIVPVSGRTGDGVDRLLELCLAQLPAGPLLFEEESITDQSERDLVAEFVREQVLRHCEEEIPYSTAVTVDIFDESDRTPASGAKPKPGKRAGLVRIEASIFVERESQKAIVIGKRGQMLKTIGTDARKNIERLLGANVYLSLRVRVEPKWSERPEALRKMGYAQK